MNNFSWLKALGFGVLIWGIMAVALWILGSISSVSPLWAHGIVAAVGGVSAFLFARNANAESGTQAAGYGLVFAAITLVLDLAVMQWFDAHIFASWQYWVGTAAVFLAPWVQTETHQSLTHHAV
jgi:hypothetical protein